MIDIKLKTSSLTINHLLDFVINEILANKLNIDDVVEDKAKVFISSLEIDDRESVEKELKDFSFTNKDNFITEKETDVLQFSIALSLFKSELLKLLSDNNIDNIYKEIDFGKFERKVSPPLEAYVYEGNNKLDINPTNRGYGTLFE